MGEYLHKLIDRAIENVYGEYGEVNTGLLELIALAEEELDKLEEDYEFHHETRLTIDE